MVPAGGRCFGCRGRRLRGARRRRGTAAPGIDLYLLARGVLVALAPERGPLEDGPHFAAVHRPDDIGRVPVRLRPGLDDFASRRLSAGYLDTDQASDVPFSSRRRGAANCGSQTRLAPTRAMTMRCAHLVPAIAVPLVITTSASAPEKLSGLGQLACFSPLEQPCSGQPVPFLRGCTVHSHYRCFPFMT